MSGEQPRIPLVTVSVVVQRFGSVLLVKRQWHDDEVWCFPAKRLEWGETLPQAVERAVRLATGVSVRAGDIIQTWDSIIHDTDTEAVVQHSLVIDMEADYLGGDPHPGEGMLDAAWASGVALQTMPVETNTAALLAELGVIR